MRLTKEQIITASDLPTEDVSVPEWGGTVGVRGMSVAQRAAWADSVQVTGPDGKKSVDTSRFQAALVAACVIGDDGHPVFETADVAILAGKSASAMQRVFDVAQRLCGMGDSAVEAAAKN